jgi:hypothetical protein
MSFIDDLILDSQSKIKVSSGTSNNINEVPETSLQRTKEWQESRKSRVHASESKDLMSCTIGNAKKYPSWSINDKIFDFGISFYKTILRMYLEKKYDKCYQTMDNKNFKYGRFVEPYIIETFESRYPNTKFFECPSIDIIDGVFSCSPDGKLVDNKGNIAGFEGKAAMCVNTYYERTQDEYHDKFKDFWQTQCEMIALKTDVLVFATALPAFDTLSILNGCNPIEEIPEVNFRIFNKSENHCNALIERAKIAGEARDWMLKNDNINVKDAVKIVIG